MRTTIRDVVIDGRVAPPGPSVADVLANPQEPPPPAPGDVGIVREG